MLFTRRYKKDLESTFFLFRPLTKLPHPNRFGLGHREGNRGLKVLWREDSKEKNNQRGARLRVRSGVEDKPFLYTAHGQEKTQQVWEYFQIHGGIMLDLKEMV